MKKNLTLFLLPVILLHILAFDSYGQLKWPEISNQSKPWSRWWWPGSAVDTADLPGIMQVYSQAGLGGLEIVPIYGVRGYEDKFIPYLSPEWMKVFQTTLSYAGELDLGIDMANGTGWPFGGRFVKDENAARRVYLTLYELREGGSLQEQVVYRQPPLLRAAGTIKPDIAQLRQPVSANDNLQSFAIDQIVFPARLKPQVVMAYGNKGESLEITQLLDDSCRLNWKAPAGEWKVVALFNGMHGKMVERAAPGAEGYALDHFSQVALNQYLQHFDSAFANRDLSYLRCFFNDSYEVDDAVGQANWTTDLLDEFENRRGYDLRDYLPALLLKDTGEVNDRVVYDYRLTISELLLENFTLNWHQWASAKNTLIRNQAHGAPANILDLYAASDIPETEGRDILRFKFASSAGNVAGKALVSAEAATWLDDHFLSSLADVKKSVDSCFLGGVNHIFYHGTAYSPPADPWPGWLFYAAVHFQPAHPIWMHFQALNDYVARCQSFLQQGSAHNDILLYYPLSDRLSDRGDQLLRHFDGMEREFEGSGFGMVAEQLLKKGYAFDYISDRQIQQLRCSDGRIHTGKTGYTTILVPECRFMPLETLKHLFGLANDGASIVFCKTWPKEIPGLANFEKNKLEQERLFSELTFIACGKEGVRQARYGKGSVLTGNEIQEMMTYAGIRREPMVDQGIQYVRRKINGNTLYFLVNTSGKYWEGWLPLQCQALSAGLFDAMTGRIGIALTRKSDHGMLDVFVQLKPGVSLLVETYSETSGDSGFNYIRKKGTPIVISGRWRVGFIAGGPVLPRTVEIDSLESWTSWQDRDLKSFSGMAGYSIRFTIPKNKASYYLLDLGRVEESAEVWLNGRKLATLVGEDYSTLVDASLLKKNNMLEIRVVNGIANRIIYMDQRGLPYRKFYNVNFPARNSHNRGTDGLFSAERWQPRPSGLLGPVTLTPLN